MKKIITVVGNRPQFVKAAVVARRWRETDLSEAIENKLVHTGQHYDPMLSDVFFEQLGLPAPSYNLELGSGPILDQIGAMLARLRVIFESEKPDGVLVYGDTNSTIAAAMTAAHMHLPLFHVEAGERNFRRKNAPEEVNRVVTDELAWLCLTSTEKARHYLLREGFAEQRVRWVGDPMYDLYLWASERIKSVKTLSCVDFGLMPGKFVLATIHRAENTAEKDRLLDLLNALDGAPWPVLLPIHPRVEGLLERWGWSPQGALKIVAPLSYFDVISVLQQCDVCVTDSGGLAREAFFAGKAAIVPMPNSGWNEIVEAGWIKVVPGTGRELVQEMREFSAPAWRPDGLFGDGQASEKIGREILECLDNLHPEGAWHPLGTFSDIPQPKDQSSFSLSALSERVQSSQYEVDVYKVGYDPTPSVEIAEIHSSAGLRIVFALAVDSPFLNPISSDFEDLADSVAKRGHALAVFSLEGRDLDWLNRRREAIEHATGLSLEFVLLDDRLVSRDGTTRPVATSEVEQWSVNPVSPFEAKQRAAHNVYRKALQSTGL